ncbi:MAG: transporter ATP-binding protein [Ferruginibacter sp.]|nr:transporter ATP-binding protein [Ferruginibacter sp.]
MNTILTKTLAILISRERRHLCWYVLADLVIVIADIASLVMLLFIIDFYTQPFHAASISSLLPAFMLDRSSVLLIALFLVIFSVKNIAAYYVHHQKYQFLYRIASRIAEKNLSQYLHGSYDHYVTVDSAVQGRRISQQPIEFSHYVLAGILQIITQTILITCAVTAILLFNASLFLLLFTILVPPILIAGYVVKKRTKSARNHAKRSSENALQFLKESLAGYVEANIYGKHNFFVHRYASWQQKLNTHLSSLQSVQGLPNRLIEIFAVGGLFILIVLDKSTGNTGSTNIISIGAFMAAAYKIMPAAVQILNSAGQVRAYSFAVNDLFEIKPKIPVATTPEPVSVIQSISFREVDFYYGSKKIICRFSAAMAKGDFIGIEGRSGSGKTTLINLLLGFLETQAGEILINGVATTAISRQQCWDRVAYVKQQSFLLHDSILKNISMEEDVFDMPRMEAAINITGVAEIAGGLSGLNTIITENGKNISGGQRQRVAIARALYKDADLIILDEPFNELDRNAENDLLRHFLQLAKLGKIIILITHNRQSLAFCNKIISPDEK